MTIYEYATAILPREEIDHHQTDLYLKVTPESKKIISKYEYKDNVTTFIDQITGTLWYDIPFAYIPGWIKDHETGWNPL